MSRKFDKKLFISKKGFADSVKPTMRKLCFVIIPFMLVSCLVSAYHVEVEGTEQGVLFEDNFETYKVGTFPSSGGWELWADGAGVAYQFIVDSVSSSQTKSLQLIGFSGWAAYAAKPFTSKSARIGFIVSVRVEEIRGGTRDNARIAFCNHGPFVNILREYAPIFFNDDGSVTSGGQFLQSYAADTWYKIKVVIDRTTETYSVWIDDKLLGENLRVTTTSGDIATYPSNQIEAFSVSQCYNGVKIYFDDVAIFEEATLLVPALELTPNMGIAATTLTGSGFAANSKIIITWDNITVPTVPSPLTSDSYGSFTAIISVLNQTALGDYVIKAVDAEGNEANAMFTVMRVPSDLSQSTPTSEFQQPESPSKAVAATASTASVTLVGMGLLVYFKKRKH